MKLGDPKYRICSTSSYDKKVIFFCDWDVLWPPKETFLGKPIYFQSPRTAGLSFTVKRLVDGEYVDLLKISPQSTYLSDLALKLVCENLYPGLLRDNSSTPLHTLCLVPTSSIVQTISSTEALREVLGMAKGPGIILNKLRQYLPETCTLGVVGCHALNPESTDTELDVVVLADDLKELLKAREYISNLPSRLESRYIQTLWPLCSRTRDFGSIDWFFCTFDAPSLLHEVLAKAVIKEWHHEFQGVVTDDAQSILSTPVWKLDPERYLVTVDGALRGRFTAGDRLVGVGLLLELQPGIEAIVVQSDGNVGRY